jgi:hypothetical protein
MADPFEYDVFISFSSADEDIVKPIWQELCSNGLRVFWSDSSLKKEAGNSWFEVIEKSLERSRHMLLICSDNSINSKWVQREYRAFFDYCYVPNSRRLIPLLTREFAPNNLPLFLRQLQVGKINDPEFIQEIIPILGGVNIEKLQQELQSLRKQVDLLAMDNESLSENSKAQANMVNALTQEKTVANEQLTNLSIENTSLKEQISKLTSEHSALKTTIQERENSLQNENILLKEQNAKLNKQNHSPVKGASAFLTTLASNIKSNKQPDVPKGSAIKPAKNVVTGLSTGSSVSSLNEVQITKADFAKLTYRQKDVVTKYGYLLSPEDAETVGRMLGNFQDKNIPSFCAQRGNKVTSLEQ